MVIKIIKLQKLTLILLLVFISSFYCQANEIEKKFIKAGLIDIHTIDISIKVDLVNSDPAKNFFRENLYHGLDKAYFQKEVGQKLSSAQKFLKAKYPEYSILVMNGGTLMECQRRLPEKGIG